MGSGISLNREQMIQIIQREIDLDLKIKLDKRRLFDDYGNPIPETFDEEAAHIKMTRILQEHLKRLQKEQYYS